MNVCWLIGVALVGTSTFAASSGVPPFAGSERSVSVSPVCQAKPSERGSVVRVGVYGGPGVNSGTGVDYCRFVNRSPLTELVVVDSGRIRSKGGLDDIDVLLCPGGDGGMIITGMTAEGWSNVSNFLARGGCYFGTCAGAYAVSRYVVKTVDIEYLGFVPFDADREDIHDELYGVDFTDAGKAALGIAETHCDIYYSGGPRMWLTDYANDPNISNVEVWAKYARNAAAGRRSGANFDGKYAVIANQWKKGRLVVFSQHPEMNATTMPLVSKSVNWLLGRDDIELATSIPLKENSVIDVLLFTRFSPDGEMAKWAPMFCAFDLDEEMNLLKATSAKVSRSNGHIGGRISAKTMVLLIPQSRESWKATTLSENQQAFHDLRERGGLVFYQQYVVDTNEIMRLVHALKNDKRTTKTVAWNQAGCTAFAGGRRFDGLDLQIAEQESRTAFTDGSFVFAPTAEGLGGSWCYLVKDFTHHVGISNATVEVEFVNDPRSSLFTYNGYSSSTWTGALKLELKLGANNTPTSPAMLKVNRKLWARGGSSIAVDARGKERGAYKLLDCGELAYVSSSFWTDAKILVDADNDAKVTLKGSSLELVIFEKKIPQSSPGSASLMTCKSMPKKEPKFALIVGAISTNGTFSVYNALARAAEREGLVPIITTDLMTNEERDALVARSSLVLIGGSISDDHFRRRYTNEVAFVTSACRQGVPVVGICHGHQMINLAFGGTIGRMPTNRVNKVIHKGKIRPYSRNCFHEITIEKGSRLYEAVGCERLKVNSSHVCEVQKIGDGLRVVARADDGVVEAIEHEKYPVSGFQFHPETIGDLEKVYNQILKAAIFAH